MTSTDTTYEVRYTIWGSEQVRPFATRTEATEAVKALANIGHHAKIGRVALWNQN
jgi:hypothetical protein